VRARPQRKFFQPDDQGRSTRGRQRFTRHRAIRGHRRGHDRGRSILSNPRTASTPS
jgi:hypothetical protein